MPRRASLATLSLLFVAAIAWTWPLALHARDHIPGLPGDNFSFLWNLWWMRRAVGDADLSFFQSTYLLSPFGVDLINHPHTALQGYLSATVLAPLSVVEAENLYVVVSVFLNALCAYALAYDIVRVRRPAVLAAIAFGGSPYVSAHLLGHYDLLTAWVIPLFALQLRRALATGRVAPAVGCGVCAAIAAYAAYYHVVYLALFAVTYTVAALRPVQTETERRPTLRTIVRVRFAIAALLALDVAVIAVILLTGGRSFYLAGMAVSARGVQNPLLLAWLLVLAWLLSRWRTRLRLRTVDPVECRWGAQTLTLAAVTFAVLCLPLIVEAGRLAAAGGYVGPTYHWRSAPRGVDAIAPLLGNPFHPLYGHASSALYAALHLDRVEAVGWIGVVPVVILLNGRGKWLDGDEARRWKVVAAVFAVWALGPFLTIAGLDAGLPLPQALARYVPLVENARMPGRAMVGVYLALAVLMALRRWPADARPAVHWALAALLAADYLQAPIPLTALERPAVYERLATIEDDGAVIEVPFGIGDGLSAGRGSQDRRLLYHATIHGHPVVGGYIGRMPPSVARAYAQLPVVGDLLRLSGGEEPLEHVGPPTRLPFRYLVLDTRTASPRLVEYVHATLEMELIASGAGRELYAVRGIVPAAWKTPLVQRPFETFPVVPGQQAGCHAE